MKQIASTDLAPAGGGGGPEPAVRERVYVGIDVGYRAHVAAACPLHLFNHQKHKDAWRRVRPLTFSSDALGFRKLRAYLERHSPHVTDFLVLLEPTGGYYGLTLQMFLLGQGYTVWQVENAAVTDYRKKTFGSETKSDEMDARLMARMACMHEVWGEEFSIQPVHLTDPALSALRVMVRDLQKITKEITRRRNQLQQVVAVTFPELKAFFTGSTASPAVRVLLERFPTPAHLKAASVHDVREALRSARATRHIARAEELHALAQQSAGVGALSIHLWRQSWIITQLPVLEQARTALVEELDRLVAKHPYTPLVESLPVRSRVWTAALIGVIGDINRFERYDQFRAYLGWFPATERSGTSVDRSRLAYSGVRMSRHVLYLMSMTLLSPNVPNNAFRDYYRRLVGRGMRGNAALGHVAGKLAMVIYGMLKKGRPYDEKRHRRALGLADAEANGSAGQHTVETVEAIVEMPELPPGFGEEIALDLPTDEDDGLGPPSE